MSFDPRVIDMVMRLRSRGVSEASVLGAFESVSRRPFLGDADTLYDDAVQPIACGQTAIPPLQGARLMQILAAGPGDKVLLVGAGSGWLAALLARQCRRVYAVERYKTLVASAENALTRLGIHNVELRHGDGRYGWPGQAPFSRILFACAVRAVPDKVLEQLGPNGRLVAVVDGQLTHFDRARTRVTETAITPMTLPMIEAGKSRAL